ncbi:energy-coupled thiamine transporter ThiT [Aerococcus sanguinicola]|uniref:Energy-coupled thiamine transporter ThiT n=2 Tax=Aerococcus sanguinicola TaxID=119206 RepID=A0A109RD43_9LACT|nr:MULTISPECIES: energy-coupled thiamine transporter ThiT [Aerococcus]AMB93726.1 hypothetical protein AWM72_02650 [Aerococcus sanguinicola]MDK7050426.1 energy-coupled thiamine transporter ThiT [Aerococcus sanguinicola]OFT94517.1 hypothetical protein HMPREF3090_05490 [Aerococcus sp. HMSC23C02]
MAQRQQLLGMIEAALMAVLAFVFALIPLDVGNIFEIELGMIPIMIFSFRRGPKLGILAGFLWGILKLVSGDIVVLSFLQVFVEYVFAFAVTGLAGFGARTIQQKLAQKESLYGTIAWSVALAVFVKYFIHFIAGVVYWSSYAPDGMNIYWYSFLVNGSSALATLIVDGLIVALICRAAPHLLRVKE